MRNFKLLFFLLTCLSLKMPSMNAQNWITNDYQTEWEAIEKLERDGMAKFAYEQVSKLLERAKSDQNPPQIVKAMLHKGRNIMQFEPEGWFQTIKSWRDEEKNAAFPTNVILQSMLGEILHSYVQNNRWKLRDRKDTDDRDLTDFRTWSIAQLEAESQRYYALSVANENAQKIDIQGINALTSKPMNTDLLRPTLYDFLAFRALEYFSNEGNYLTEPAYRFELNTEGSLSAAETFVNQNFESRDSTSQKWFAIKLYQNLIRFHLNDKNPTALIHADLMRLKFAYNNAVLENKKELYQKALENLLQRYENQAGMVEISGILAQLYMQRARGYQPNPDEIGKWDFKTAKEICEKAIKKYPKSHGSSACRSLLDEITDKNLLLRNEKVWLPNKPILAALEFRNVATTHVRLVRLKDRNWNEKYVEDYERTEKELQFLLNQSPLQSFTLDLPNEGDFRMKQTEFKIEALPLGHYAIVIADNMAFSPEKGGVVAFSEFSVSSLALQYITQPNENKVLLVTTDRETGKPLKNVVIEFWKSVYRKNRYVSVKSGSTMSDEQGFASYKSKGEYENIEFRLMKGKDTLWADDQTSAYYYGKPDRKRAQVTQIHFFTDRKIYRPSQTIYFKGIAVQNDSANMPHIVPNLAVDVVLKNANWQEVKRMTLTTNEYGTFQGSFAAPSGGLMGNMTISIENGKREGGVSGQISVRVEEYKRPKFEVKIEPTEGVFVVEKEVTFKGNAKAYSGSNVDGAKVKYRIERTARFPYMYDWRYFSYYQSKPSVVMTHGETVTDGQGNFKIPFQALADKSISAKQKPVFTYKIFVDVTDLNGETHSAQGSLSAGYHSLDLDVENVEVAQKNQLENLSITTQNLNGQPIATAITIKLQQLNSPAKPFLNRYWEKPTVFLINKNDFKKDFPQFAYGDEDAQETWAIKKEVGNETINTDNGKAALSFGRYSLEAGTYRLTVTAKDPLSNDTLTIVRHITIYDINSSHAPSHLTFFHRQEKNNLEPQEKATLHLGTADASLPILVEWLRGEKTLSREWLTIKGLHKVSYKISEQDRGGLSCRLTAVSQNRQFHESFYFAVPWSNKDLKLEISSFRDKLLPASKEEWRIKISGKDKDKVAAELLTTMYDASLDALVGSPNAWSLGLYPSNGHNSNHFASNSFGIGRVETLSKNPKDAPNEEGRSYRALEWHGFLYGYHRYGEAVFSRSAPPAGRADAMETPRPMKSMKKKAMPEPTAAVMAADAAPAPLVEKQKNEEIMADTIAQPTAEQPVQIRTNLNETVFFYPNLETDAEGNVIIKFTMGEALTKWRFMALAHTKNLEIGTLTREVVTQKDLMVFPNMPRFVREGDEIEMSAKISNLSKKALEGKATLQLFDAATLTPVDVLLGNLKNEVPFTVTEGGSAAVLWRVKVPKGGLNGLTCRVIAKAENFSDGEETTLPVLTNRMLVTETLPLSVRGGETRQYVLKNLEENQSKTLTHHALTLEFTSNPAWYAVQSLPYLMEYPHECAEQMFSRLYANSLATHIANSHPKIKAVFEQWKGTAALESNLLKNQELKSAILEETPWVLDAQNESERKKRVGLLFDLNKMANEQERTLSRLAKRQSSNGGWSWFEGGRESWYITQHIVEGVGHLNKLGVDLQRSSTQTAEMVRKAVGFIDSEFLEYYKRLEEEVNRERAKWEDDHLSDMVLHYLYARSFFSFEKNKDIEKARQYFVGQAEKYWNKRNVYAQGLIALTLQRDNKTALAKTLVKSLAERSVVDMERGMYWQSSWGYNFNELPIETQALMIEVFDEITNDAKAVDDMRVWLLKNKQTNDWKTTKATAAAIYALLLRGGNAWLTDDATPTITLGAKTLDLSNVKREAGTGYFKMSLPTADITRETARVQVSNPNKTVAWGALYWQYFEDLDNIKSFKETPLKITKKYYKLQNTDKGEKSELISAKTLLERGDKVMVRIEIRVDRPMEYVHLKDMRAAGLEPVNVLSRYKWQGGLGYYESTRDVATHFFIDYLPKGVYVFEYPLVINHRGDFSNGITTMQCMYAPEFSTHSAGGRLEVR